VILLVAGARFVQDPTIKLLISPLANFIAGDLIKLATNWLAVYQPLAIQIINLSISNLNNDQLN
jgi:hypothetical protein